MFGIRFPSRILFLQALTKLHSAWPEQGSKQLYAWEQVAAELRFQRMGYWAEMDVQA